MNVQMCGIFDEKYQIRQLIASGAYGQVYEAKNVAKNYECALKVEDRYSPYSVLRQEAKLLKMLNDTHMKGVPIMHSLHKTKTKRYMCM